jgi:hypothetical protein
LTDSRYNALKSYIESGGIKSFTEIFDIVPKGVIIKDSGINYERLTNKISHPDKFTVKDVIKIAKLIGIDPRKLFHLLVAPAERSMKKG